MFSSCINNVIITILEKTQTLLIQIRENNEMKSTENTKNISFTFLNENINIE